MDHSFNWMKVKSMRSTITGLLFGLSFCTLAAQTYCSKARAVSANRVRIEVCYLKLSEDRTYEFVVSNYIPTFWGKPSELNPIRTETESGSYHASENTIQFFQELPDLDTFALRSVGNRRLKACDENGHPNGFTLKKCRRWK
jgi:hypothetical protein